MSRKVAAVMLVALLALMIAPATFAQDAAATAHATNWVGVAAAIALGIAAAGCGIGQGLATAAACEGTARNPGAGGAVRIAFIIGVALIESLTLYALVIVLIK
jgi:F-type H+-transporting ATPase subunit c